MSRIAKKDVHNALRRAADHICEAGGSDGRVSRKDIKEKLATLKGDEKDLVDSFFRFIDERDSGVGSVVTKKDVDKAVAYAMANMVDKYDLNNNGLSKAEIANMPATGQTAVSLARELKKAAAQQAEQLKAGLANEARLDGIWSNARSKLNAANTQLEEMLGRVFSEDYDMVVVSPHHYKAIPIDGDSFTFAASVFYRLQQDAKENGKEVKLIANPADAESDGKMHICLLPVMDGAVGYIGDERQAIEDLSDRGIKAALFVGDTVFNDVADMKDHFGMVMVNDHHQWSTDLNRELKDASDGNFLPISNYDFDPHDLTDKYSSGAVAADLLRETTSGDEGATPKLSTSPAVLPDGTEWDPQYDLLETLSLVCDKYDPYFPSTMEPVDAEATREVASILGFLGTYLLNWKGGDAQAKREIMVDVINQMTSTADPKKLHQKLVKITEQRFGDSFTREREDIIREVNNSIDAFLASDDPVYFHEIKSDSSISLLVHKMAYARLNKEDGFGERVLVHYQIADDGNVSLLLGRDADFSALDVSKVCVEPEHGVKWGGGHKDRAGFSTKNEDPALARIINDWWGPGRDIQKIVDLVRDSVETQLDAIA